MNLEKLKSFVNELSKEDIEYLESILFDENGSLISKEQLEKEIEKENDLYILKDSIQYALKINLNSVYGAQILSYFKFSDEWQTLGASTTLTGRILSKFGLIETIECYFNPEREVRYEFPLSNNIAVAADNDEFYRDKFKQKLRVAVISDTDSVTGDALLLTNNFKYISFDNIIQKAKSTFKSDKKTFYFFEDLKVANLVNDNIIFDDVEFIYAHKTDKDLYDIETEDGKIITVTEDHSIMVKNGDEIIEKKPYEITENDIVLVMEDL